MFYKDAVCDFSGIRDANSNHKNESFLLFSGRVVSSVVC